MGYLQRCLLLSDASKTWTLQYLCNAWPLFFGKSPVQGRVQGAEAYEGPTISNTLGPG
jgi:hypothetical protein